MKNEAYVRVANSMNENLNKSAVEIQITEHAVRVWQAYSMSFPTIEVAAALVGPKPIIQKNGKYSVHVNDILSGKYLCSNSGNVVLTADCFSYWNKIMSERYPADTTMILGWAHSHPRIPVFFSGDDVLVHRVAFTNPFQVALVSDPHQPMSTAKFFAWSMEQNEICDVKYSWPDWCDEFGSVNEKKTFR